jgi:hypothetical protein
MIDQLIKLVQQNASDTITKNATVPPQFKGEAAKEVAQGIFSGIQNQVSSGNIQDVMGLLKNGGSVSSLANNTVVTNIISSVAGKFAAKFGIPQQTAQQIASSIVPKVVSQFISKTNDPNDNDFDLQDVIKSFSGGSGFGDLLGKFTGGGPGKKDEGGVGGMLGGLFK